MRLVLLQVNVWKPKKQTTHSPVRRLLPLFSDFQRCLCKVESLSNLPLSVATGVDPESDGDNPWSSQGNRVGGGFTETQPRSLTPKNKVERGQGRAGTVSRWGSADVPAHTVRVAPSWACLVVPPLPLLVPLWAAVLRSPAASLTGLESGRSVCPAFMSVLPGQWESVPELTSQTKYTLCPAWLRHTF